MGKVMKIAITESLNSFEHDYLMGWKESVFPIEGQSICWSSLSHHILARENNKPIAHIGFGEFTIQTQSESYKVIGVGGVVVRPEFQGKNIPSLLFKKLHESQIALNYSNLFALFCPARLVPYYTKHGYSLYRGPVSFMQDDGLRKSSFNFMIRGLKIKNQDLNLTVPTKPW